MGLFLLLGLLSLLLLICLIGCLWVVQKQKHSYLQLLNEKTQISVQLAQTHTRLEQEQQYAQEKYALLLEAKETLSVQFKNLANDILEEKSKKFTEHNQQHLGQLLLPLQDKIKAFQHRVEENHLRDNKDRSVLIEQIKQIKELNQTLSLDTQHLTKALQGDRKMQGTLGEIILEDILEKSGLKQGQHFKKQQVFTEDNGKKVIPDVIIYLPKNRQLIVDSKMSLPDYRAFANADKEEERLVFLKKYAQSVDQHIKILSEKQYQTIDTLHTVDCVLMFIPLEAAFLLAVEHYPELFEKAFEKNILITSPNTLLYLVRLVHFLWREEDISQNAQDISQKGAELYDKLVGFVESLKEVGLRLNQAQHSYEQAMSRLATGRACVIDKAEQLKALGVKPNKSLPQDMVMSIDAL